MPAQNNCASQPLFVEELVKMILESGLVREDDTHYVLTGPVPALAIPSTLHDSLMVRLDRLSTTRTLTQLGAVLGREFAYELLQAVASVDETTLQQGLAQLMDAELIYQRGLPPQSQYIFKHALIQEPSYRVQGILTDGFDSTTSSMRALFPGARLGNCLRHALIKLPKKLVAIASPVCKALRSPFHTLWYRARQRKGLWVFALGQRLRRFADHVAHTAGMANGERVRRWFQAKLCREKRQGGM